MVKLLLPCTCNKLTNKTKCRTEDIILTLQWQRTADRIRVLALVSQVLNQVWVSLSWSLHQLALLSFIVQAKFIVPIMLKIIMHIGLVVDENR